MSDWISINTNELIPTTEEKRPGGIQVRFSPSPYDLPEAIRCEADETKRIVRIQFRYLDEPEPATRQPLSKNGVVVHFGKHSARVYEVEVHVDALERPDLRAAMEKVLESFSSAPPEVRKRPNFRAIRVATEKTGDQLIAGCY